MKLENGVYPERPVLYYILDLRREKNSTDQILRALNASSYPPPRGWRKWDLHAYMLVTGPWYEEVWPHLV